MTGIVDLVTSRLWGLLEFITQGDPPRRIIRPPCLADQQNAALIQVSSCRNARATASITAS